MNQTCKRFLMIALVLILMLPVAAGILFHASAATVSGLADTTIGLEYDKGSTDGATINWTASGNQITGSLLGASMGSNRYKAGDTTLTITNNRNAEANLSFDISYEIAAVGSVTVNGTKYEVSGSQSVSNITLAAGESIKVKLMTELKMNGSNLVTVNITNIALVYAGEFDVTFPVVEGGSYTVNGEAITQNTTLTNSSDFSYTVSATPAADYKFIGWYNETAGQYLSMNATASFKLDMDCTVYPVFVSKDLAVFDVGGYRFGDLGEAVEFAVADGKDNNIVLIDSGKITGDYTIPAGETLLIPFDDAFSCYTYIPPIPATDTEEAVPAVGPGTVPSYSTPVAYKTLTMADGSSITVEGVMSVSAPHYGSVGSQNNGSAPSGNVGMVKMEGNSMITVTKNASASNGGVLYAWGFIYGSGSVLVEDGGLVYEYMQIADFRGGSATAEIVTDKLLVFPFSQYYVQNVEVPMTFMPGAGEFVFTSVTASNRTVGMPVEFIGGEKAMFSIKNGSITKEYLTDKDRLLISVNGDAGLSGISLELSQEMIDAAQGLLPDYNFDNGISSSAFILSLTNNITINVNSGKTVIAQDMALLPGVEINIAKGAELNIASGNSNNIAGHGGYNVFLYDLDQWGPYVHPGRKFTPVVYAPGRTYTRTEADLKDAVLNINGTLSVDGFIYSTAEIDENTGNPAVGTGGGNVMSSEGTGKIFFNSGAGDELLTRQIIQNGSTIDKYAGYIAVTPLQLQNLNSSATQTSDAQPGDLYFWDAATGKWVKGYVVTWKDDDGSLLKNSFVEAGKVPVYPGSAPTKAPTAQYTYTFAGWTPELSAATGNVTYTATYSSTVNKYTVTWKNEDGSTLFTEQVEYGKTPSYQGETPTKAGNAQYTYAFKGWDQEIAAVTGDVTYKATYSSTVNKYTVTWKNEDGNTLFTEEVEYGKVPSYQGETPTKEGNTQYSYIFKGWDKEIAAVTGDVTYKATYTASVNKYTVTWQNENGSTLFTEQVEYGKTPSYQGETPVKEATAQYSYTFKGWDKEIAAVTGNVTYKATYTATVNKYTVTWQNADGSLLTSAVVEYGKVPTYQGATPTQKATAQYTYTFKGWDKEMVAVTGNVTYKATYTATVNKYTVIWQNEDGSTLTTEQVEYGKVPTYQGQTPTKKATVQYTYTFKGWDKEVVAVTGNATYKATYTATVNKYTVTWKNEGGSTLFTEEVAYGTVPTYQGETPTKEGNVQYSYVFKGWDQEVVAVTGDVTYKATYTATVNKYTVTWQNEDGSTLFTEEVEYGKTPSYQGETPTKAANTQYTYTFKGWDKEIAIVTGNVTYTATYSSTVNKYTVTWQNEDGSTLFTEEVEYGKTPSYQGETPTKAGNAQYTFTFKGWDQEIAAVTGDVTYTATYSSTVNKYTVTWKNEDGSTLFTEEVEYGKTPSYQGETPTKEGNAQYSYVFDGWTPAVVSVTDEATYTATFKQVVNKYTVTWQNEDGSTLTTEEVEYGKTPSYQGETPTKEATAQYTFTFKGWDQEIVAVTGDVTYKATYSSTVNKYTVTWQNEDGTVLFTQVLEYGEMPSYVGETPTKAASAQYTFTFRDWDKNVVAVTGDVTYIATYHYTVNNYTVKFVDEDGRVLQENVLPYGTTPEFVGETPVKAGNVQYSYRFVGWDKEIVSVTGDATYTAIYLQTVNKYTITWIVDGEETTEELEYGAAIAKPIPTKEHYTFTGWTPNVPEVMPGENLTFTATWRWSYTGFLTEDSKIFYYVDGVKQSCGLVLVDGYYYYVRTSSGEVVTDRTYWVTYTNDLMDEGNHTFDEQGRMIDPPGTEKKNGFYEENGAIYYYVEGELQKCGLVFVDGYYYYVRTSSGEVVTDRTYWVTYTNNLVEEGNYTFDAEGRMINPPAGGGVAPDEPGVVKNGFVSENGGIYYYVDGQLQKCGLVKVDGYYYYVRTSSGEVVTGRTYWITYTNDLMEEGNYTFDEQGRMILD